MFNKSEKNSIYNILYYDFKLWKINQLFAEFLKLTVQF